MTKTTLQFPTLLAMIDFQMQTGTIRFEIDTVNFTLTGNFCEADLELAQNGFAATIVSAENI